MKRQILFFITSEFPYGSGETFIENEITFLADSFNKVVIIPLQKSSQKHREVPPNIDVKPFSLTSVSWKHVFANLMNHPELLKEAVGNSFSNPMKNKVLLRSLQRSLAISAFLEELIKEYQQDEIFLYSYWLDDGAVAISFVNSCRCKFARAHGWDIYCERHRYNYLPLRPFLASQLDRIFTVSEDGRLFIMNKTRHLANVQVSRLGTINRHAFENKFDDTHLNVLSISSVIPLKRIHLIGGAVRLLNSSQVTWHHFGDGALLSQMKRDFPFCVFHGHVTNDQIKQNLKHYLSNTVLINTSTTEGIPVSMMEAMSFGIPCIGTDVGGVSEIIEDGYNGFLMPANPTPNQVAASIQKYKDLSIQEEMQFRLNAFDTWKVKYDAAQNYRNFVHEVKSL